ncbi:MAG: C4-dicarboxylate ABC transporter [Gammaproteobacteria bacterium]|nr:C4-dicarboxylate ABC transporter [Gammaproteobacteria bacterium]
MTRLGNIRVGNLRLAKFLFVGIAAVMFSLTAQAAVFKIATVVPEGSDWMLEFRTAAEKIKTRTEGRVIFKFYGGGIMGNDKKVLKKIRIGQLQGGAFSTGGLVDKYHDIELYGLPFVFNSQAEVDYVREKYDAQLLAGLREAGFMSFGFAGGGFANFMSGDPIHGQQDLEGRKLWIPDGDFSSFTALKMMNLSPVVLPLSDVLTGLQTGLLDVVVAPPSVALLLQWYTKVSYINPLPVSFTLGILAIDNRAFDRISEADQDIVTEVMTDTYVHFDQANRIANVKAEETLLKNGLQLAEANDEIISYWRGVAKETNAKIWTEKAVDKNLLAELVAVLAEYRAMGGSDEAVANAVQ